MREAIVSLANVGQPAVVEQDLLKYESGDCFAQFTSAFHYSQAKWNNFGRQQESDDFLLVGLHQRPNHSQTR